jgi:hypothetical protein
MLCVVVIFVEKWSGDGVFGYALVDRRTRVSDTEF